jgi:hypothetical protein
MWKANLEILSHSITRTGRHRWALWLGFVLTVLTNGLLSFLDDEIPAKHWFPLLISLGIGIGILYVAVMISVQATASLEDATYAAVTYTFLRSFGTCVGIAIGGTVFQKTMVSQLKLNGLPEEVATNAVAFVISLKAMAVESPTRHAFVQIYTESFRRVFQTLTGIMALGLVLSLFIKERPLDRRLNSAHTIRRGWHRKG